MQKMQQKMQRSSLFSALRARWMLALLPFREWSVSKKKEHKLFNMICPCGHMKDDREAEPWQKQRGAWKCLTASALIKHPHPCLDAT